MSKNNKHDGAITIPRPEDIPAGRGIDAAMEIIKTRSTRAEKERIKLAAKKLGLKTPSAFQRWVMVKAADEVLKRPE